MATPRPALGHAVDQLHPDLPGGSRRSGPSCGVARGLVLVATATLALTLLSGTAAADPEEGTSAAQLVPRAAHDLEVVTEQVNEARETLAQQQAAVQSADRAAAEAQSQLDVLDGHIRQVARAAFTSTSGGDGMTELDLLMTSGSAEEFVSRLATLDAIAGHTDEVLGEVAESVAAAQQARADADAAQSAAQRTLDDVTRPPGPARGGHRRLPRADRRAVGAAAAGGRGRARRAVGARRAGRRGQRCGADRRRHRAGPGR